MIEYLDGWSAEYEAFVAAHPKGTLFQSRLWSGVKPAWRWRAVLVRRGGELCAAMAVLIRPVPGTPWRLLYAPRGPVCNTHDAAALRELTEGVRVLARQERACALKLDPDVPMEDAEFRAIMERLDYRLAPETGGFERIQPQHVARLDLCGKTKTDLLAGMKQKMRYNIRLAERRGVEVRVCGAEALDDFHALMRVTGARDGFCIRPKAYFARMLDALGAHARLYMAYADGAAIAGAIAAQYGNKTWYLYGASANVHRDKMPNYLLQWRMIEWALEAGCDVYDFRGVAAEQPADPALAGLWRFKSGWGAAHVTFVGEYELVVRPAANAVVLPVGKAMTE